MTVNGLSSKTEHGLKFSRNFLSQDDLVIDPLQVLRCDKRVFRCGPILEIILYVLKACLAASRTHLMQHLQEHPIVDKTNQHQQQQNVIFNLNLLYKI